MKSAMVPPMIRPTVPPGTVPGERRLTWDQLLGKPDSLSAAGIAATLSDIPGQTSATKKFLRSTGTGTVAGTPTWDTIVAADVTGDVAATRKFLRSLGSGSAPGTTLWDTLTAADIGPGLFGGGAFTIPGALTIRATAGKVLELITAAGAPGYTYLDTLTNNAGVGKRWRVGYSGSVSAATWDVYNETDSILAFSVTSAGKGSFAAGADVGGDITRAGTKVVSTRKTGWTPWTGTASRATAAAYAGATASASYVQSELQGVMDAVTHVSQGFKALVDDLHATAGHGLVGT